MEGSSFQEALVAWLPPPSKLFEAFTGDQGQLVLPAILSFTQGIGGLVSAALIILFLSIYWSINQIHFERLWLSLLPSGQRKKARGIWRVVEPDIGSYIRGQVIQSLLAGLLLGLGYWLLGSPYPVLLALAGALASLIPMVGAPLAIITALVVGLLTSVQLSLFTTLYALVILIAMLVWVKPWLFHRRWDNPILTSFCLLPWQTHLALSVLSLRRLFPWYAKSCGAAWSAAGLFQGQQPRFRISKSGRHACGRPSGQWMDRLWH